MWSFYGSHKVVIPVKPPAQLLPCGSPHYSSRINNRDMNNSGNGNSKIVVIVVVKMMVTPPPPAVILFVVIVPMAVRSTVVTIAIITLGTDTVIVEAVASIGRAPEMLLPQSWQ